MTYLFSHKTKLICPILQAFIKNDKNDLRIKYNIQVVLSQKYDIDKNMNRGDKVISKNNLICLFQNYIERLEAKLHRKAYVILKIT